MPTFPYVDGDTIAGSDFDRLARLPVNAQSGTTYTLVLADEAKLVTMNNAAAQTVTLPQDSSVAIPVGGQVQFLQLGAGQVSFAAGTGATVQFESGFLASVRAQRGWVTAVKVAANTWQLLGALTVA
jgi:hypothetical protein